jgi:muramoyltetrapeptide carboxypeptidase
VKIKPSPIKPGDRVGVIAPAGPVKETELQPGLSLLKSLGFHVSLSPHLYDEQDYLAGEDARRLHDLHMMFQDKDIHAVWCARGGYGTMRLLDRMNFELIGANPKIFVGYSDITALLLALYKKTGLVTFHGPVVRDLPQKDHRNVQSFFNLITAGPATAVDLGGGRVIHPGHGQGILLGGNLSLICHLIGTPFMPSCEGALLFIEEKGESPYRVDRMITHLKLSGLFDHCAGLMIGQLEDCGDESFLHRLLQERLSDLQVPVVRGLAVGHGLLNTALPIGVHAALDTEQMALWITESCVSP